MNREEFNEIRSFRDDEVEAAVQRIASSEQFQMIVTYLFGAEAAPTFLQQFRQIKTIDEFQCNIILDFLVRLRKSTTGGVRLSDFTKLRYRSNLFITNHRDIVLDSAFLNMCLCEDGVRTSEIAIGDNLLIYPWIADLVRLNKSFIVKRSGTPRELLQNSIRMSAYIRHDITERQESVWIAQREGRCKDSNDRTQESLLKMLALSGEGSLAKRLKELHMVPISISYEHDPCDYLKAKEFQLKRDNPNYKKTPADDLLSMKTGVMGQKGRVHFYVCEYMDDFFDELDKKTTDKAEQCSAIAQEIDRRIHAGYELFPGYWVALDWLKGTQQFTHCYTQEEKEQFEAYIKQQLDKIDLPNKDEEFLLEKLLSMYANPVINHLNAKKE